jgi:hypothetical protein
MNLDENDIQLCASYISKERLKTFRSLTKSDHDAIELHQHMIAIGASLMSAIGTIEIACRNYSCLQIEKAFGRTDWLRNPPPSFRWHSLESNFIRKAEKNAQRAAYAKLDNAAKKNLTNLAFPNGPPEGLSHHQVASARQSKIDVSEGQVTAQLTLHFWKRLYSSNYEKTLWKRALKRAFPNKTLDRADIANNLEILYQTRNRVAHNEPIYSARLHDAEAAIEFIAANLAVKTPTKPTTLEKLLTPYLANLHAQKAQLEKLIQN